MVPPMARRNRKGGGAPRRRNQARRVPAAEYRQAVNAFQASAFWNLRTRIANVGIVVGVLALFAVVMGGAGGARLGPTLVCALGGLCGAGVYVSGPRPALTRYLLIATVALTALGIFGLVLVVQVFGR